MRNNPLKQMRAARMRALAEGTAAPVAFFWDDPELLTAEGDVFQIWFNDMIDDWFGISAAMIVEALMIADGRDVLVHLNSPGGMVTEGLAIHSTFKQYAGNVTMRVEGLSASAASFVMLAANEVLIEPNAMVMIHDAWDITIGPASEHRKTADLLDKVSNNIASMYGTKAEGTTEDWRAAMLEETWYVGQEAVDAGLADTLTDAVEADSEARNRWSGIFARAPRRQGQPATKPPASTVPASVPAARVTDPSPEPAPEPVEAGFFGDPAVSASPTTPSLEDQLKGIDLSAIMREAFPQKGVPA